MADFTDRIKLVFDAVTQDATKGVGNLKTEVGHAETGFGKLKAGAGGALDAIKANAGLSAAAAGTAIAAFVTKAVGEFQQLALSANNFGDAVGLSVEDASRWMEVAGDVGVNVETLQSAVGKLNINASKGALKELGIGGDTTNERLQNALSHLAGITDSTERAKQGMALFGKSWTTLVPLIETAGELKGQLAEVSDAKVINEAEVQKAKDLRDAMDELNGIYEDFMLTVGGEAAGIVSDFAQGLGQLGDAAKAVSDATGGIVDFGGDVLGLINPLSQVSNLADGFRRVTDFGSGWKEQAKGLGSVLTSNIPVVGNWADGIFGASDASDEAAEAQERQASSAAVAAQAAKDAAEANAEQEASLTKLTSALLATFSSQLGVSAASDKTTESVAAYGKALDIATQSNFGNKTANDELAQSQREAEQAALAQAAAAAKLATDQAVANGTTLSAGDAANIQADALRSVAGTMAVGSPLRVSLENYASQLETLPATKNTTITADTESAAAKVKALSDQIFAIAGKIFHVQVGASTSLAPSSAPSSASASVSSLSAAPSVAGVAAPVAMPRALSSGSVVNNISVSVSPLANPAETGRAIADALDAFYRRNGTRARAVA